MKNNDSQLITRFDDIYNLSDCRAYYRAMYAAKYCNAQFAVPAFLSGLNELKRLRGLECPNLLDFASGYGIGALMMRNHITLEQVLDRYQAKSFDDANPEEVIRRDKQWLEQNQNPDQPCNIFAIDVADQALAYGEAVGIFDAAYAIDLQTEEPSDQLLEHIQSCNMIFEVGSVAHMLPQTLKKILDNVQGPLPWVITSPIRGNESTHCMEMMKEAGLVVEAMPVPPFQHRIFMDDSERERAIDLVKSRGHETEGFESKGAYHAQLYLARPEQECTPIADWLDID